MASDMTFDSRTAVVPADDLLALRPINADDRSLRVGTVLNAIDVMELTMQDAAPASGATGLRIQLANEERSPELPGNRDRSAVFRKICHLGAHDALAAAVAAKSKAKAIDALVVYLAANKTLRKILRMVPPAAVAEVVAHDETCDAVRIADITTHLHYVPLKLEAPEKMQLSAEQRKISDRANEAVREAMGSDAKPRQIPFTPACGEGDGFIAERYKYLEQLQEASKPAQSRLNKLAAKAISLSTGELFSRKKPKSIARMLEKNPDNPDENLDVAASSIVYETIDELYAGLNTVLNVIDEDPDVSLVRFKDRFENPCFSGLRDMLLNVKIGDHVTELQLRVRSMHEASKIEHGGYGIIRTLNHGDDKSPPTGETSLFYNVLQVIFRKMYVEAYEEAKNGKPPASAKKL